MSGSSVLSFQEYFEFTSKIRMQSSKKENHYHNHWEIYYLVDGVCCFFIDNKSYRLTAGDVALFPPGIIHKANYETPTFSRLLIYCGASMIPPSAEGVLRQVPVFPKNDLTAEPIREVFDTVRREYHQPDEFSADVIQSKVSQLLLLIARESKFADRPKGESSVVELAVKYIRSRYMDTAAPMEARVPTKKSSGSAAPLLRLNSRQPMPSPGIAAGVISASTHSASDARNCTAMVAESGNKIF